jgi:hypothetical protein
MVEYEVFGSGREKGCRGGDFTYLAIRKKRERSSSMTELS